MKIIICVYFVIQILKLSSIMVLQINQLKHIIVITLSCLAYLLVSFKNPGYYQKQTKNPSFSDEIQRSNVRKQDVIKQEMQQDEDQEKDNGNVINNENNGIQNNLQSKIQQQLNHDQISLKIKQENKENKDVYINEQNLGGGKNPQLQHKKPKHNQNIKNTKHNINKTQNFQHNQILAKSLQTLNYCRICKIFQPYRVRHCHQCQKCICTFDHHCPWMSNCIGQKNRYLFWIFLLVQFVQSVLVSTDILIKTFQEKNSGKLYFFATSVILVTLVATILLLFHTYLMLKNLTTWEFLRWDRIAYLTQFKYKKSSPFSYGLIKNINDYFCSGIQTKNRAWKMNPQFILKDKQYKQQILSNNRSKKSKKQNVIQTIDKPQTQRILSPSSIDTR